MVEWRVSVPGSCGELVQGTLDGLDLQVTCPIDWWVRADLRPWGRGAPPSLRHRHPKAWAALRRLLDEVKRPLPGWIRVESPLPRGKGMASSTAELVAVLAVASLALGRPLDPGELADRALQIEPSDGLMFPGLIAFGHRSGRLRRPLGVPPPLRVWILDPGGRVNTVAFHAREGLESANREKEREVREALRLLEEGLRVGDPRLVGAAATRSALAHQAILPKPALEPLLALSERLGCAGVNVAHSGTVLGLLCDPERTPDAEVRPAVEAFCREHRLALLGPATLVGGGVRVNGAEDRRRF